MNDNNEASFVNNPSVQSTSESQTLVQPMQSVQLDQPKKKKRGLILGFIIGAVLLMVVVVLLIVFLGDKGKTVSCKSTTNLMGINLTTEYDVWIGEGEVSGGKLAISIDLKNLTNKYIVEKDLVEEMAKTYEEKCNRDCSFDKEYVEKDHVKYTLNYGKDGIKSVVYAYGVEGMSAKEIADKIQGNLEKNAVGETTCVQK